MIQQLVSINLQVTYICKLYGYISYYMLVWCTGYDQKMENLHKLEVHYAGSGKSTAEL